MAYFGTIKDLAVTIKTYLPAIVEPSWFDRVQNRIRATVAVESGTVTTVTTVTGITNVDGFQAKTLIQDNNLAAWALVVRTRI